MVANCCLARSIMDGAASATDPQGQTWLANRWRAAFVFNKTCSCVIKDTLAWRKGQFTVTIVDSSRA
jgi:hypothetical protein